MDSVDTMWYLSSETTFTADDMTFSNPTAVADDVTTPEDSALLTELLNWTAEAYSGGNSNHMSECITLEQLLTIDIIRKVLYILLCVVGLLGNTLVIYVLFRFSKMQTVTKLYIVNLAVADECFLIGMPFLTTTTSRQSWLFGNIMCKAYVPMSSISKFASPFFLTILSAERYIAVCHPISASKFRTPFISKVVSLMAWIASAIFSVPDIMYATTMFNMCFILWPDSGHFIDRAASTLYYFFLQFAVPVLLSSVFCFLVIRKLKTAGPENNSTEEETSHLKDTKLLPTLIAVFVLCWLPHWIIQMRYIFNRSYECPTIVTSTIILFAAFLIYANSAMKSILYAILSDDIKKSFLKACTCAAGKEVNTNLQMSNITNSCKEGSGRSVGTAANY